MRRLACILIAVLSLAPVALGDAAYPTVSPLPSETQRIGSHAVTVTNANGTTSVRLAAGNTELEGSWGLPIVTLRGQRGGLSHDGSAVVVVRRDPPPGHSVFAVADATGSHVIDLPGTFSVDALAPGGGALFLVQHLAGGDGNRYAVRVLDVATGLLAPHRVATKDFGESWESAMDGRPLDRAVSADGAWVFTLYRGRTRPFVHALRVTEAFAFCFDLPVEWQGAATSLRLRRGPIHQVTVQRRGRMVARISVDAPGVELHPSTT